MKESLLQFLRKGTLYRQLIIGVLVVMLVMLFLASQSLYTYTVNKLFKVDKDMALQTINQTGEQLTQIGNGLYSALNLLVFDNQIRDIARSRHKTMTYEYYLQLKAVRSRLTTFISSYPYIESIYIYINGTTLIGSTISNAVSPIPENSVPIMNSPFYKQIINEPFHSFWSYGNSEPAFYLYPEDSYFLPGKDLLAIGCSYQERGKGIQYTVIISIDPVQLNALLNSIMVDENPAFLLNDDGRIIASTSGLLLGEKLPFDIPDSADNPAEQFLAEMNGESVQVVYKPIENPAWRIVKVIPVTANVRQANEINQVFIITFLLCIALSVLLIHLWIKRCLHPMAIICNKMTEVSQGQLGVRVDLAPNNEFGNVIRIFNDMSANLANLYDERLKSAGKLRRLEIKALRAQMNPHFIYNTLNMVKWMAFVQKAHNIEECVIALAEMLRPIFKSETELTAMSEEVAYLNNYIKILSYRFGNLVDLSTEMDAESQDALVPRFIIQPIVENSIYHGRYTDDRLLRILIKITVADQDLVISVQDNGKGISPERLKHIRTILEQEQDDETVYADDAPVGIVNVHRRIQLHFGKQYGLQIESLADGGTAVTIRMKYVRKDEV
ncbi:MAG TPA: hypothetical protein DD640_09845 [Clostridiales bacterium]|nr:hypothetical protein [Clostridiales bacterium]